MEEEKCEAWEGHIGAAVVVRGVRGWRMLLRLIESECGGGGGYGMIEAGQCGKSPIV